MLHHRRPTAALSDVGFALIGTCQRRQLVIPSLGEGLTRGEGITEISRGSRDSKGGRAWDANDASDQTGSSLPLLTFHTTS